MSNISYITKSKKGYLIIEVAHRCLKKIKQRFSSQTNEKKALRKTHFVQCYSDVIFMLFEVMLSPFPSEWHFSSTENQKYVLWNDSTEKGRGK